MYGYEKRYKYFLGFILCILLIIIFYIFFKGTYSVIQNDNYSFLSNDIDSVNSLLKIDSDNPYILDKIVDDNEID